MAIYASTRPDRGYDCVLMLAQEPTVLQSLQGTRREIRGSVAYFSGSANIADGVCNIAIDAVENRIPLCAFPQIELAFIDERSP
jgi:hypothetical protein